MRSMRVFTTASGERLAVRAFDICRIESCTPRSTLLVYSVNVDDKYTEKEVIVLGSFDAVLNEVETYEVPQPWEQ